MSDYKIDTLEIETQIVGPAATTSVAGLQSATDKTKLDSVQSGATANSSDAALRDRSTHTGSQLSSTISDFSAAASTAAPVQSVAGQTGIVVLSKTDVGLGSVDNTSDLSKPISTLTQTALNNKYDASNPSGFQTAAQVSASISALIDAAPATLDTLNELAAALGDDPNFAATTSTALGNRLRVDTAAQALTGTEKTNAKTNIDLQNVDNTSDLSKPVSTAQSTAIGAVQTSVNNHISDVANPHSTTKAQVGLGNVDNTSDATKNSAVATLTNKTLTSPVINSPTGIVKADVGLNLVDNTSDLSKPISTATQTALNLKYDASNPSGYQTAAQVTSTVSAASTNDRARANHTGTQLTNTLSDFNESVDDRVAALVIGGTGITSTYNDVANTLTIASTVTQYTDEQAQDAVGTILTDSSSVDFTYNDVANTITAAVLPAGVNHNALQNYVANQHVDHSTVSISAGTGLSGGGDLTATRTLNIANTGVIAAAYGSATNVATFSVNAQGQITSAASTAITFPVTTVFGRAGAVIAATNDYTWAQINKATSSLADITTRSAGDLSSGTLLDARLSANVPLKDTANTFIATQTINNPTVSSQLNIDAAGSQTWPAKIVFTNTAGTGDCQIVGDGGDFGLQSGGGRALQHYGYHEIILQGGRTTTTPAAFVNGSNATYNTRILNTNDSIGLSIRGAAGQTADLLQVRNSAETELVTVTGSGQLSVGQGTPDSSAVFQVDSTTQGILLPRMTSAQRLAIATPASGLMVYDTDLGCRCVYSTSYWTFEYDANTTAIQSSTSTTYANITEFITASLEPGLYAIRLRGIMQSTALTTGVGLRLVGNTATVSELVINWKFGQAGNGTDKHFEYAQILAADNITSQGVLTANANFPAIADGVFRITVGGSIAIQLRSEINASGMSIRPNSTLIVRKVG